MDFIFARAIRGRAVFAVFASPDERVRRDQHHDGASGNHVPCRARKRSSGSGTHFREDAQAGQFCQVSSMQPSVRQNQKNLKHDKSAPILDRAAAERGGRVPVALGAHKSNSFFRH